MIKQQGASFNLTVSEEDIQKLVEYVYNLEFKMAYTIKYQYQNSGLISSALSNVVLMEFDGLSRLLTEFAAEALLDSQPLEDIVFQQLEQSGLDHSQVQMAKTYWALGKASGTLRGGLEGVIRGGIEENPLMMVASYRHRELIYHPSGSQREAMYAALESCPSDFQVVSTFPFYEQLANIRYFFKSVIQIFTFVCAVVFFYTMRLILKQVYEEKEIEVGIWRTLGAGGVSQAQQQQQKEDHPQGHPQQALGSLKLGLSLSERMRFGYKMLVKVGFIYYWLLSCVVSVGLYQGCKWSFYWLMADLFGSKSAPPLPLLPPIVLLLLVFGFTLGLVVVHIREIYVNPLVSTIKPVKRTFDLVKIRVIKIATFGITVEILVTGVMLVYYGVVSYYWIPLAILEHDGELQTALFNSIFIFLILGSIMLLVILQARMETWVLRLLFRLSPRLNTLKLIMLKSIKAKQYKNLKVSLIISLIFAFLLFVTAGINIELKIIESFSERAIGADLMIENLEK